MLPWQLKPTGLQACIYGYVVCLVLSAWILCSEYSDQHIQVWYCLLYNSWNFRQQSLIFLFIFIVIFFVWMGLKGVIGCPFSTSWYDSLGSYSKVYNIRWLKFLNGNVKQHPFLSCQNQLCFQQPILVHVPLNANELCSPRPSLLWGDQSFS